MAGAHIATQSIGTGPAVLTGVRVAFIYVSVTQLTLPSGLAVTLVAVVVRCMHTGSMVGTGVRSTRGEQFCTGGSAIRWLTETCKTGDPVHTGSPI